MHANISKKLAVSLGHTNYLAYFCRDFRKTFLRSTGCSAVGSAPGLGPGGRPFESGHPDSKGYKRNDFSL